MYLGTVLIELVHIVAIAIMHGGSNHKQSGEKYDKFPCWKGNGTQYNLMKYDNTKPLCVQIRHISA